MQSRSLALLGIAAFFCGRTPAYGGLAPSLGEAASFAVLGGASIRNTGTTRIAGNVGPESRTVGLPASAVRIGTLIDDASDALRDAAATAEVLDRMPCGARPSSLSGTLDPGVYCFEAAEVADALFLDAGGDRGAVWVFLVDGTLTTVPDATIRLLNGGLANNVFWRANETHLGARTAFAGNIFADSRISFGTGASLSGRALAPAGTVVLDSNEISLCCGAIALAPAMLSDGIVGVEYPPRRITATGGLGDYTFTAKSLPPGLDLSDDGVLTGVPTMPGSFTFSITALDEQRCPGTTVYTIAIAPPPCPIAFLPPPPSEGIACLPYSHRIGVSGCTDCAITAPAELLPPGLSLSDGVLSGTPTLPGEFPFPVTARDAACARTQDMTVTIACRVIAPPAEELVDGTVASMYEAVLRRGECPGRHTFDDGPLPPGLDIDDDGVLRGIPSKRGRHEFTVTSAAPNGCKAEHRYILDISCPLIILGPEVLPAAIEGVPYETKITAQGAIGPYDFSSASLPAGVTLSLDGTLTVANPASGVLEFDVTARDRTSECESTRTFLLIVTVTPSCKQLTIRREKPPPKAIEDAPYTEKFEVEGGTPPYVFTIASGALPPGLTLSGSGTLSGTPVDAGTHTFSIRVTDAAACTGVLSFCAFDVSESSCPVATNITLSPPALERAMPGVPYGPYAISAAGGAPPYSYSVTSGALPPGVMFVGGILSGTPTSSGRYRFTITAVDDNGCRASHCYVLLVSEAIPTLSQWMLIVLSIVLGVAGLLILGGRNG